MAVIILFSILCVFVVVFLFVNFATKTFISKTNFCYMVPSLLLVWAFYSVGYHYAFGFYDGTAAFETLAASIWAMTFRINREYISDLIAVNKLYMLGVYASIALCGVTTWSAALAFVKVSIVNFVRTQYRLHRADCDIVYGTSDDAMEYCRRNKHAILWINPRDKKLDNDEKKDLYLEGIAFVLRSFNVKSLQRFLKLRKTEIQIVCFQENEEFLFDIFSTIEGMPKNKGPHIAFKVESDNVHIKHIESELNLRQEDNDLITAECFDSISLVARDFSLHHNIARYLPASFLDHGAIPHKKNIKVVMYGFAKTGQAIFETLVEQNQFVERKKSGFACKKVQYDIYDIDGGVFNTGLFALLNSYVPADADEYGLPPFEMTVDAHAHVQDVNVDLNDRIAKLSAKPDDDTFYVFVLCLDKPMDNAMLASRVSSFLDPRHGVVFYCVNYHSEALLKPTENAIAFGFKGEILRHDCLADDEMRRYAEMQNRAYGKLSNQERGSINNLPVVEMRSNISNELNIDFKLALLGLCKTAGKEGLSEAEFDAILDPEQTKKDAYDYKAYQKPTTCNLIAYQEHLRWCMYYFINGFVPMRLSEVHIGNNGKIIHKDLSRKTHACLTSYKGLDVLHKHELQLYLNEGHEKAMYDVETYKYDIDFVHSIYAKTQERGYSIVRFERPE